MELSGYLAVARRWWWTLLVAVWVAALSGYLVASKITPTYEAQTQLLVGPINTDIDTLRASGQLVQTYASLAVSTPLLDSTVKEVGGGLDPIKLGQNIRTTASDVTRVLQIRVQDSDPARAAQIANTISDELVQLTTGATTRPEGQLEVIAAAVAPTTPIAPNVSLIVILAMAAGLIGGLILVVIIEYATDTIRDRGDLARVGVTDVLATIAAETRVPGRDPLPIAETTAPSSSTAIGFRTLAAKVAFADADQPNRTILITSTGDGDSGYVAGNLAAAIDASGHRVVVIDASPDADLTTTFGLSGRPGLDGATRAGSNPVASLGPGPVGVRMLPRGGLGPSSLIAAAKAREILDQLLADADVVVIDGGTIQNAPGALSWAGVAETTLLVVRRGPARRDDVRSAIESLHYVEAAVGGAVLLERPGGRASRRDRRAVRNAAQASRPMTNPQPPAAAAVPWAAATPEPVDTATQRRLEALVTTRPMTSFGRPVGALESPSAESAGTIDDDELAAIGAPIAAAAVDDEPVAAMTPVAPSPAAITPKARTSSRSKSGSSSSRSTQSASSGGGVGGAPARAQGRPAT